MVTRRGVLLPEGYVNPWGVSDMKRPSLRKRLPSAFQQPLAHVLQVHAHSTVLLALHRSVCSLIDTWPTVHVVGCCARWVGADGSIRDGGIHVTACQAIQGALGL